MALINRVVNMDTTRSSAFAARLSVEQVEEGQDFAPKFDVDGLIACVTTDADTSDVLMVGYICRGTAADYRDGEATVEPQ